MDVYLFAWYFAIGASIVIGLASIVTAITRRQMINDGLVIAVFLGLGGLATTLGILLLSLTAILTSSLVD